MDHRWSKATGALKALFAVLVALFSQPLFAQNQPGSVPEACGNLTVSMAVKLTHNSSAPQKPEPAKALMYFIQQSGMPIMIGYPTTKIGIDGQWVGANKKNSYFSVSVAPGEHHLCAKMQTRVLPKDIVKDVELAHLMVEAGKVYYYRTRIFAVNNGPFYLSLAPVDSDEAEYLIASDPLATARVRK